ncbi:hypothetical protein [Pararobbsia silviterrae]|uniref:Uncharacterized protein n=1 Tax=Pararobbsia silviterrae TaxID=1792498 RepID=A0A494XV25_9BURK|nr:hypothetical protein [Pararobbsia silviterrae]RKP51919.1 hypothetical protein D7S86_18425 [Pararobbsia silviterrae]
MKQTVVGVFETSEEARRAHSVLLEAGFQEPHVRVSAGAASRGVDEGMAYPLAGVRAPLGADAVRPSRGPAVSDDAAVMHTMQKDGMLDRLTDFFKDLFAPESAREEMLRYEAAMRRGGALVAVDVDDEIERSLASDILVRAGAYDLEERVVQWAHAARHVEPPEEVADLGPDLAVSGRPARTAAQPGNVTSMDPSDPTGYRATRTDFTTGETAPAMRTTLAADDARSRVSTDASPAVRQEDLRRVQAGAGMASWDRFQGDFGVPGDFGHVGDMGSAPAVTSGQYGEERVQPQTMQTHEAASRASSPAVADTGASDPTVSDTEARHLLASGAEVFLDDCGFARTRHGGRVQPMQEDAPTRISRHVRVYSRRADDPLAQRDACARDDSLTHLADDERIRQSLRTASRDAASMAARDRRMTDASLRARDVDDGRETESFMPHADEPTARDVAMRDAMMRPDPASGDWAADWQERAASQAAMRSPGPDELEADRLGDEAAMRGAAALGDADAMRISNDLRERQARHERDILRDMDPMGEIASARDRLDADAMRGADDRARADALYGAGDASAMHRLTRPTGADELARHEAALREAALSDAARLEALGSSPSWRDVPDEPGDDASARAAEFARREALLRDETLHDYASMDERAEMRAANAAAAAHASGVRHTEFDDGAPRTSTHVDDDDRRYATQDASDFGPDDVFVDTRDMHRARGAGTSSDWQHMKEAMRHAWHRMTHPGRHH